VAWGGAAALVALQRRLRRPADRRFLVVTIEFEQRPRLRRVDVSDAFDRRRPQMRRPTLQEAPGLGVFREHAERVRRRETSDGDEHPRQYPLVFFVLQPPHHRVGGVGIAADGDHPRRRSPHRRAQVPQRRHRGSGDLAPADLGEGVERRLAHRIRRMLHESCEQRHGFGTSGESHEMRRRRDDRPVALTERFFERLHRPVRRHPHRRPVGLPQLRRRREIGAQRRLHREGGERADRADEKSPLDRRDASFPEAVDHALDQRSLGQRLSDETELLHRRLVLDPRERPVQPRDELGHERQIAQLEYRRHELPQSLGRGPQALGAVGGEERADQPAALHVRGEDIGSKRGDRAALLPASTARPFWCFGGRGEPVGERRIQLRRREPRGHRSAPRLQRDPPERGVVERDRAGRHAVEREHVLGRRSGVELDSAHTAGEQE